MYVDRGAMKEISISLTISLIGLLLMSSILYKHVDSKYIHSMHYLFILNSMLCFKNNIELNYADSMSSAMRRIGLSGKKVSSYAMLEYVFDCGTKMFVISGGVSFLIGVFSNYQNILQIIMIREVEKNFIILVSTVLISFFSGVCGSISTFVCVVGCIWMSISLGYNPDNIILPVIASSADYIITLSLTYFTHCTYSLGGIWLPKYFERFPEYSAVSLGIFITNIFLILMITTILSIFYLYKCQRKTPKLFNVWSFSLAFGITIFAGILVNWAAEKEKWIGLLVPLFNGLSGGIALIYTGKVTTFISRDTVVDSNEVDVGPIHEVEESPDSYATLYTLLLSSLFLSIISCIAIRFFFSSIPAVYIWLFGGLLIIEVVSLYNLVNFFIHLLGILHIPLSCHLVPLLNASSELLGTCMISIGIGMAYLLNEKYK
ncbi:solute carrier family 41 [Nematocida sp. LUAm3]|nr:solute carrier family 41 [Nematocida sp. LUAm3]KAI5173631.1 solute carrier family 41 [Nematocida sp. LUAm2]KAI5176852.1 solute carrier family 41 [Nematocida sp. LUAm1]